MLIGIVCLACYAFVIAVLFLPVLLLLILLFCNLPFHSFAGKLRQFRVGPVRADSHHGFKGRADPMLSGDPFVSRD